MSLFAPTENERKVQAASRAAAEEMLADLGVGEARAERIRRLSGIIGVNAMLACGGDADILCTVLGCILAGLIAADTELKRLQSAAVESAGTTGAEPDAGH